jgi:hypothetical protein
MAKLSCDVAGVQHMRTQNLDSPDQSPNGV